MKDLSLILESDISIKDFRKSAVKVRLFDHLVLESGVDEELLADFLERVVEVQSNRFQDAIVVTDLGEFLKIFRQKRDCEGLFVMKFRDSLIQKLGNDVFVYDLDAR